MKSSYLENWERLAGLLLTLGVILPFAVAAKMEELMQMAGQVVLVLCSFPFWLGVLLMLRVKAAQRAADRLLNRQPEKNDSIKYN